MSQYSDIEIGKSNSAFIPQNLTIKQFGEVFGPGVTKTYSLLKSGDLKGVKIGRLTYIPRAEAERWHNSLPAYTPQNTGA